MAAGIIYYSAIIFLLPQLQNVQAKFLEYHRQSNIGLQRYIYY